MGLEDVIEKAFLVRPDDSLTHAAFSMAKAKKYEAFVLDKDVIGIVTLDDIVKRRVSEPQKTKVLHFMRQIRPFSVDSSVEDIMNYMLVSEYRSLPVKKEGMLYSVSKPRMLKFVKDEVFEGKKAEDVMQFPYCASEGDTLFTVVSTMKDTGMNRIPILNVRGGFAGLVDSMDLIKALVDEHRSKRGERFGDKTSTGEIGIKVFARSDVLKVSPETGLKQIVKRLSSGGKQSVIVEREGKFLGMITIKDIFKLIGKSLETVYVRVTGLGDEDDFIKAKIDGMIENTISKMLKSVGVKYVAVHVDTMKRGGKRKKYSVHGRIVTDKGSFHGSHSEWDPTKAMKILLSKIEREIRKSIGKERAR